MSKERNGYDVNNDEDTNDIGSDSDLRKDNAKRVKLSLSSDTTLQELPIGLLENLLVKAVATEVVDMKLAKSVWNEKADLVISRLSTDCDYLQWSNILTSKNFRSEVYKTLDGTAQQTFQMKLLLQSPIESEVIAVTSMKDEIFMLLKQPDQTSIVIYDRSNTADVKDVIALPGVSPTDIAGCGVSNCVYALTEESPCSSVSRITKDEEHQFSIAPWISDLTQEISFISPSSSGNLVVLSRGLLTGEVFSGQSKASPAVVKIYGLDGSLQHEILLPQGISSIRLTSKVIQKSNGNLLLTSISGSEILITEINVAGRILRQCKSSLVGRISACMVEIRDRILTSDCDSAVQLLDSELNPLDFPSQKQFVGQFCKASKLHFNSERKEVVRVCDLKSTNTKVLTIFRFTED